MCIFRDERSFNQSLRQQQDEAYQASLLADQEKVGFILLSENPVLLSLHHYLETAFLHITVF